MDTPLIVREFDIIIGNSEYENSAKYKYLPEEYFQELIAFVKEFSEAESTVDATEFLKIGYRKGVKDTVSLNNYVGLIELPSGFQIEVLPKVEFGGIDESEEEVHRRTKEVFLKMLQSLKEFEGKAFTNASLKSDRMNLYEIFISMYIREVQSLVKHGIKSSYNCQEDNLRYYKGKLKVSNHIRNNLVHKERFYVEYEDYTVNRPENKIVKSTLLKLMNVSNSDENIREIRKLLPSFELVEESFNYDKDFSCIVINRNTKAYETLMTWSKVYLYNRSFTTFAGVTSGKALLFPMEKVFEEYVAKWVKKVFGDDGWNVSTQDRGYHLFDSPKRFALRPDIVAKKNNLTVIMDTKWKRLYPDIHNYGISQADMYQMYVYSKKYMSYGSPNPEVWLLYPIHDSVKSIQGKMFTSDDGVVVHIFFVNVDNRKIEESIKDLLEKVKHRTSMEDLV